jgi:integral membrane sensor domain MASE1
VTTNDEERHSKTEQTLALDDSKFDISIHDTMVFAVAAAIVAVVVGAPSSRVVAVAEIPQSATIAGCGFTVPDGQV